MSAPLTMALAHRIAEQYRPPEDDWSRTRDLCDVATQSQLDAYQLDLLTDWTMDAARKLYELEAYEDALERQGDAQWERDR